MNSAPQLLHEVVITAIIVRKGKYLITRRSSLKKRFAGMWTVPGGKLETNDYANLPKDTKEYWYNVLEQVLRREVKEEVGLSIRNIEYVTSLATIHADGAPSLVISCMADWESGDIMLQESETDEFAWVSLQEAKDYDLIDGIYDELQMADARRRGVKGEWGAPRKRGFRKAPTNESNVFRHVHAREHRLGSFLAAYSPDRLLASDQSIKLRIRVSGHDTEILLHNPSVLLRLSSVSELAQCPANPRIRFVSVCFAEARPAHELQELFDLCDTHHAVVVHV